MHFTLLFKGFSLSANFTPCLEWISSVHQLDVDQCWVPHHSSPRYKHGDLVEALLHFGLDSRVDREPGKLLVIVHESNQVAEKSDLDQLVQDCMKLTSDVQVISPWDPQDPMYKYLFMHRIGAIQD